LNPRDRAVPRGVGRYDERKALAAKVRADRAAAQRRALAARLGDRADASRPRTNVLPLQQAR
jgi:hypothetical protein